MIEQPVPHEDQITLEGILSCYYRREKQVGTKYKHQINHLRKIIDYENRLYLIYLTWLTIKHRMRYSYKPNIVLTTSFSHTFFCNYQALTLTNSDFWGSARILLRQSFESLVIAKFTELEPILIKKWENGEDIYLTREVMDKLKAPKPEMKKLWKLLNWFTHPTIYAQQPIIFGTAVSSKTNHEEDLSFISTKPDLEKLDSEDDAQVIHNYALLLLLLECNYHLLNSHLWHKATGYVLDSYGSSEKERARELKREIRKEIRTVRKSFRLKKNYTGLIQEYRAKWELK